MDSRHGPARYVNGKIDAKQLILSSQQSESSSKLAQNGMEAVSCKLWSQALGIRKVGVYDDFFSI
jgi:hypothetical protein